MKAELEEIKKSINDLNAKVSEVNKKTSSKWTFPIVMLVLTSLASLVNFYIQQNYSLDFANRKIYAESETNEKINFYGTVKNKIEDLSDSFEGYCNYKDTYSDSLLTKKLRDFYSLYKGQLIDDISLIDKMKKYSIYVSEASVDIQSEKVIDTKSIFSKSEKLKMDVLISIDSSIDRLK
ncbi:hypothetical protein [Fluviicola sp.]|uniref:hypothetical protein n=1 Tax=Fluviicola sp. TaxID=1917219 RepID=UPI003D2A231A